MVKERKKCVTLERVSKGRAVVGVENYEDRRIIMEHGVNFSIIPKIVDGGKGKIISATLV